MSLHADEQFLAAVAAALGETIALVRRRGFHLEPAAASGDPRRRDMSNLNRGLDTSLMKFECDGDGTGFLWKKIPQPKTAKSAKRRKR